MATAVRMAAFSSLIAATRLDLSVVVSAVSVPVRHLTVLNSSATRRTRLLSWVCRLMVGFSSGGVIS